MSKLRAGILALAVIGLFTYFGFTKANPFSNPFQLHAVFDNVNNLKPRSPVRIAGIEVGKVKKVEPITEGEGAAKVTMEVKDKALPIHNDAVVHVRSRIFLEGNFFLDLQPGSPSAPKMKDGATIPVTRTSAPVQFGQVLSALQSDTREDLKSFLREYSKGLEGKGARGFNESIKYWDSAYRNSALANDATLGEQPTQDLQRVLKGQARTLRALNDDPEALKSLITDFNTTAGAFARQDAALEASVPALRDTLEAAQPALLSLNNALPTLRAFSRDALPGVRSSPETLDASLPFIQQARRLVSKEELRGTAAALRRYIPSLVRLNERSVSVASEGRQLSRCTNQVLVPYMRSRIPDVEDNANTDQQVRFQIQRGFPGLSGESRLSDGNTQYFHGSATPNPIKVQPAPPTVIDQPPPRRPDVPCETQQTPDLHGPKAVVGTTPGLLPPISLPTLPLPRFKTAPLMKAKRLIEEAHEKQLTRERAAAKKAEEKKELGGDSR
jgi:phospholipid/cholesterol/gamma-HCH transport system substrate-binding protein